MKHHEAWRLVKTYLHMAVPWAWAFDMPFEWIRPVASHFGGIWQGLVAARSNRIKDEGAAAGDKGQ